MNRLQIKTRVIERSDRTDPTTATQVVAWIDEVVRTVEQTYPLSYCKKSQEAAIQANTKTFTLPTTLILVHPFQMLLQIPADTPVSYKYLVKVGQKSFNVNFPQPTTSSDYPEYWILRGGTNALNFDVYPVHNQEVTLRLQGGYFYTGDFAGDSSSNWLTEFYPDIVIEGVCNKLFEHYGETGKADRAYQRYNMFLNGDPAVGVTGLIPAEKMMQRSDRYHRVKTIDDLPLDVATKKRTVGY